MNLDLDVRVWSRPFYFFISVYSPFNVTRHSQRQRSIHFTTGKLLYCFSLPFTTHGVEDTTSLIDWHLSFSTCFLNDFFFYPFLTFQVWTSLYMSHCRYAEILVRHYILIPFLFGRVYQAGTYFVGNQHAKRVYDKPWHWESHWIISVIYSTLFFLFFFFSRLHITSSVPGQNPRKLHLLGV